MRLTAIIVVRVAVVFSVVALCCVGTVELLFSAGVLDSSSRPPMFLVVCAFGVAVGVLVAHTLVRNAVEPMVEIGEAMQKVSSGDFSVELSRTSNVREINEMARSFTSMVRELASIETLRSDFVANVSHEFKTPLAAIEGYATLLQTPGLTPQKHDAYVAHILHSTQRLSELTGNVLLLSRIESQGIVPQFQRYSLDEQLREAVLAFESVWTRRAIEFDVDLDEVDCYGSAELMAFVWHNLVGNAVKFVPDGGHVRVSLRRMGGAARVEVADDGPGMTPEVQGRVFEKFYQGDVSHATQGSGLGLALVERVVHLHGGSVQVDSVPGEGATFTVTVPLVARGASDAADTEA